MNLRLSILCITTIIMSLFCGYGYAQVNRGQQQFKTTGPPGSNITQTDTTEEDYDLGPRTPPFTIKRYFRSLAHKDTMNIFQMFAGSIILPGTAQIYNRQYWKLPVVYGAIGGFAYTGYQYNMKWMETQDTKYRNYRDMMYAGAVLSWWGSIMDGVVNFESDKEILPARATLYSALLPGLGQAYNGDYWKLPIIYGGFIACTYFITSNNEQFKRFSYMYREMNDPNSTIAKEWSVSPSQVQYLKNTYRRWRDYSVLATLGVYVFNIVDANISAHMQDFDISEDLSATISPGIISPITPQFYANTSPAVGLNIRLKF